MATQRGVGASLKLSTDEAVSEIKKLLDSITKVKKEMTDLKDEEVAINVVIRNKGFQEMINKLSGDLKQVGVIAEQTGNKIDKSISDGAKKAEKNVNQTTTRIIREMSQAEKALASIDKKLGGMPSTLKAVAQGAKAATKEFVSMGGAGHNALNSIAEGVRSAGFLAQSASSGISQLRGIATDAFNGIRTLSQTVFEAIGLDIKSMVSDAVDQEEKLQLAEIGLKNMFGGDTEKYLDRIKETARVSATLNAGDLADYISQIAPVSSNFDQAYNAALGIVKTVAYGGGDPSSQMGYVVKNIRDVLAKGTAQKMDINQFNRAMPLLAKTLEARGLQQFVKDGQLEINKNNIGELMDAFASLNDPNAPQYAILEQMSHTLSGAREIFSETVTQQINTLMEDAGIFDFIQDALSGKPAEEVGRVLEELGKGLKEFLSSVDWNVVQREIGEAWQEIKDTFGEFGKEVKSLMGVSGKNGATQFFVTLVRVIKEFIKGIIQGGQEIAKFLGWLKERLGDEGMDKLANTLGRLVTQGWLLEKAFSAVSSVILTMANALFMFSNLGGKVGSLFSGLGNIGTMAGVGGGIGAAKTATSLGLAGKAGAAKLVASSALHGAGLGALFFGIGQAAGAAIEGLELFGEDSTNVGEGVKTVGDIAGGAIMGLFIGGPWGALLGGIAGAIKGLKDWKKALEENEAKKNEENIMQIKESAMTPTADKVVEAFRKNGGEIDLETKAGAYAYNQLLDYLENTPQLEWNETTMMDKLISALYYKRVGEAINAYTTSDNAEFQNAGGGKAVFVQDGKVTQAGQDLAALIREFNLVGYGSRADLYNTPAEKLIEEYLNGQELTTGQLDLIKQKAEEAKNNISQVTTNVGNTIGEKIDNGLNPLQDIKSYVYDIRAKMLKEEMDDVMDGRIDDVDKAKEVYGEDLANMLKSWQDWGDGFHPFAASIFNVPRNEVVNNFGTDAQKDIADALLKLRVNLNERLNGDISDAEKEAIKKDLGVVNSSLESLSKIKAGDYEALNNFITTIAEKGGEAARALAPLKRFNSGRTNSKWDEAFGLGTLGKAAGGFIRPIYRARGGMVSRGVDTIPAMLQKGEFVQRTSAVQKAGLGVMNALNRGDLRSAYRQLATKVNAPMYNQRGFNRSWADNRRDSHNQTFITNTGASGVVDTYSPFSNVLAGA